MMNAATTATVLVGLCVQASLILCLLLTGFNVQAQHQHQQQHHQHGYLVRRRMMNNDDRRRRHLQDNVTTTTTTTATTPAKTVTTVSPFFQWETYKWTQRNIESTSTLNLIAFDEALRVASTNQCDMGITATVFDESGTQIFQETVGSNYHDLATSPLTAPSSPWKSGWNGNTTFALYSNSKIFATVLYMASVVETGLGYLDEPLFTTYGNNGNGNSNSGGSDNGSGGASDGEDDSISFSSSSSSDYVLTAANSSGRMTPRMILSHQTGIQPYNRNDPISDPLYSCLANPNTTLSECVELNLVNDNVLATNPGSVMRYSNDPFYIMADLMVRKTGAANIQELMDTYINKPLGINATYDCPLVGSTPSKPHVSWGICATGHDVPKLIQQLSIINSRIGESSESNLTSSTTSTSVNSILTPSSVREIMSFQGDVSSNADEPLAFNMPLSNCLAEAGDMNINFLIGYGLGTMITAGVKGLLFVHAATVGGYWVVAPGKYSAYFAFMKRGAFPSAYLWIVRIIDQFERASTFRVGNPWDVDTNGTLTYPNEITPCVDGMFIDTTTIDDAVQVWEDCPIPVVS